ncbi:MAG: hypothetical protein KAR39_12815 [Thermoplasmata archaeon]|nr:hypothetical protein [Thermoplasmata archaeon]
MDDDRYVKVRLHKGKWWAKYWRVCYDGVSCNIPIHVDVEVPRDKISVILWTTR